MSTRYSLPGQAIKERKIKRYSKEPTDRQGALICNALAEGLGKVYPGHKWRVVMREAQITIINPRLSGKYGYTMHMSNLDPEGKALMRAGGEVLERFGCTRGKFRKKEVNRIPRDARGDGIPAW